jgi:hypothetical protein
LAQLWQGVSASIPVVRAHPSLQMALLGSAAVPACRDLVTCFRFYLNDVITVDHKLGSVNAAFFVVRSNEELLHVESSMRAVRLMSTRQYHA